MEEQTLEIAHTVAAMAAGALAAGLGYLAGKHAGIDHALSEFKAGYHTPKREGETIDQ